MKVTIRTADKPGDMGRIADLEELAGNMGEESWQIQHGSEGRIENIAVLKEIKFDAFPLQCPHFRISF